MKGGKAFGDPLTGVNSLLFSSWCGSFNSPFVAPVNPWERRLEICLTADSRNLGFGQDNDFIRGYRLKLFD